MSVPLFLLATLGLLFAPGPTNTLMALAGAAALRQVPRLILAAVLGYATTVLPLAWAGRAGLGQWPDLALMLKLAATAWVSFLAVRLWNVRTTPDRLQVVTGWKVYFTTVLNPKAIVVGLVLLPRMGEADFALRLALFACAVVAMAMAWAVAGAMTGGRERMSLVQRCASVWLGLVSAGMAAGVLFGASSTS